MKILITGGVGFIGCSTALKAMEQGHEVFAFDNLSRLGVEYNLAELNKNDHFFLVRGDVRNYSDFKKIPEVEAIIHLAAQPGIPWSIANPRYDFEVNALGTLNVLEFARERGKLPVIYASCYDEKTRALTRNGLKRYTDLKIGDIVFSLNPRTEEVEEKVIARIIVQNYKGQMVRFKGKRENLLVTPNHRMYIKVKNWKGKFKPVFIERADRVSERRVCWLPSGKAFQGKNEEFISLDQSKLKWNANQLREKIAIKDLFYLIGLFIGDGTLQRQKKKAIRKTGLNRKQWLSLARQKTQSFLKLRKNPQQGTNTSSVIFFHIPEKDRARKHTEKTLENIGAKWHTAQSQKAGKWGIYFSSVSLFKLFSQCGKSAYEKKIPSWILEYDSKYLRYLYQGLMDSDGDKKGRTYTTISPRLVENFVELAVKLGKKVSVNVYEPKDSYIDDHKVKSNYSCYMISIANFDVAVYGKKNSSIEEYSGKIWCVEVPDNENLLVERDGKFAFCGNTNKVYSEEINKLPMIEKQTRYEWHEAVGDELADLWFYCEDGGISEDFPIDSEGIYPHSPYGCSKYMGDLYCQEYYHIYGVPTVVNRQSCIAGRWQQGCEDQGWVAYFCFVKLFDAVLTIYGNGKQVRDVLNVDELADLYLLQLLNINTYKGQVFNIGGGPENTASLIEIMNHLVELDGRRFRIVYQDWRPADHRIYISSLKKIEKYWKPKITPIETVDQIWDWAAKHRSAVWQVFKQSLALK